LDYLLLVRKDLFFRLVCVWFGLLLWVLGTLAVTKLRSGAGNDEWRGDELLATVDTTYPMALELTHTSSVLLLRIGNTTPVRRKAERQILLTIKLME
jgi:hypothetical protein